MMDLRINDLNFCKGESLRSVEENHTLTVMRSGEQEEYEAETKRYSWKEQKDLPVSLDFAISKETAAGFHFSEWLHIDGEATGKVAAVLEGESGRRIKLRYPIKFLKEQVMKQEGCDEWIRTQASISFKGKFGHHKWKAPAIYMVTGVQLVKGGDVFASGSRNTGGSVGIGGDPSLAAGLPPGTLKVKVEGGQQRSTEANNGYGYEDERVWAAQFMEVDIEYGDDEDVALGKQEKKESLPKVIDSFRLKDIADLKARGIRGFRSDEPVVKPPKPIARVVCADLEEESPEDTEGVRFDEMPYVEALKDTSWTDYDDHLRYLEDEDKQVSPTT